MNFEESKGNTVSPLGFQEFGSEPQTHAGPLPFEQTHNFSSFPSSHLDIEDEQETEQKDVPSDENVPSMFSWAFYQRYFDVDTPQVKERLVWSFLPRPGKDSLTQFIRPSPDLYGPFWVCVTLVFCIAIMGNIADYLHSGGEGQHWRYDFRKVSISATTIFSYALLLPMLLWVFLWWRNKQGEKVSLGLMEIVCLYGYSLAIYIPISVLWTIPFPWTQWTLVFVGAALSGSVLVLSLWGPLSVSPKGLAVAVLAAVLFCHFLLAAGLQLYFFRYSNEVIIHQVTSTQPLDNLTLMNSIREREEQQAPKLSEITAGIQPSHTDSHPTPSDKSKEVTSVPLKAEPKSELKDPTVTTSVGVTKAIVNSSHVNGTIINNVS
nr:EOG090X0CJ3 [Polyphemus pediculus]